MIRFYRTQLTAAILSTLVSCGFAAVGFAAFANGIHTPAWTFASVVGSGFCVAAAFWWSSLVRDSAREKAQAEIDRLYDYIAEIPANSEPEYRSVPDDLVQLCAEFEAKQSEIGVATAQGMKMAQSIRSRLLEVDRKLSETEAERDRERTGRIFEAEKNRDMLAIANRRPNVPMPQALAAKLQPAAVESTAPTRPDNDDLARLPDFIRTLGGDKPRDLDVEVPMPPATKPQDYAHPHVRNATLRKVERVLGGAASVGAMTLPAQPVAAPA